MTVTESSVEQQEIVAAVRDRYDGAKTVVLRRNYRSLAPILD